MSDYVLWDGEKVKESVDLVELVLNSDRQNFEDFYDGVVEDYEQVVSLRDMIGSVPGYDFDFDKLPSFGDFSFEGFDYDPLGGAEVFYAVPGDNRWLTHSSPHLGHAYTNRVVDSFVEEGLLRESDGSFIYGEKAFPYLMLAGKAEELLEQAETGETYEVEKQGSETTEGNGLRGLEEKTEGSGSPYSS